MDSVQPIAISQHAIASKQIHRTALMDPQAPWEALLAQEISLAKTYFANHPDTQTSTMSKQIAKAENSKPAGTELTHSFRSTQLAPKESGIAQTQSPTTTATIDQKKSKIPALPVEDFATRKDFLKMADVKLDKNNQHWSATWEKPKMFNFGMLLKPALVKNMTPGESYSFVSQGKLTTITRTGDDQLLLQRGEEQITLSASELRNLLSDHISVNGLNVFLDRRGNLVMEARGPKALSMPTVSKM